jgi:signal transduction histidine kinase
MDGPDPPLPRTAAIRDPTPDEILAVRVGEQYQRLPVSQATVLVNAVLMAVALGRAVSLWFWAAAMVAAGMLRLAAWALHRGRPDLASPRTWDLLHMVGAAVNGALWGALPALFFQPLGVAEHMFLGAVVVGMVAGAASSSLGHPGAFAAFAVPALAPLLLRLLSSSSELERAGGILAGIFAAAMWALARTAARQQRTALLHRLRNDALVDQLSAAGRELAAANAGLEEKVRRRTGELVEMERRLGESALLAGIGSLAAAVAHDINNPLASLISSAGELEEEIASSHAPLSPGGQEALADVRACAERVRGIVRSLGDVTRVDGPRASLDLREIVEACLRVAGPELRARVRVLREMPEPGRVLGERGSLSQVILGLILHLARAVPEGRPDAHPLRIEVRSREGAVAVELLRLAASGAGELAPERASRDLLSPLHASVGRMGGMLQERSDGRGFVLTLPADPAPDEAGTP